MAKKKRKDKELARLRREVEILRAQVAEHQPERSPSASLRVNRDQRQRPPSIKQKTKAKQTPLREVDPKYIRADLLKSGILTIVACAIVTGLYIFRARIPFL